MRLGVHVSIAGGLLHAVAWAERLSCSTMQIFSRSPRGGVAPALAPGDADRFDRARRRAGIAPLAVHGPYIMNLASPEPRMWSVSIRLLREECDRAAQLGADYLVTHVGSHRGRGVATGVTQVSRTLNDVLEAGRPRVMILLENTAGSGEGLGDRFEHLAAIRRAVRTKAAVGFCLDTAHLFAAGYPIHTDTGLEETFADFDRVVGLEHLKLIHLNDSKVPFASRVDRHWHIGRGHIGMPGMRRLLNHVALRRLPVILETPKVTEREDRRNLATVRRLVRSDDRPRRLRPVPA